MPLVYRQNPLSMLQMLNLYFSLTFNPDKTKLNQLKCPLVLLSTLKKRSY